MTIEVGDPGGQRFEELEVMVDPGAIYSQVPREMLERLGVPVWEQTNAETAEGRTIRVDAGNTVIRLEGREFPTPVIFAEEGRPSLLGVMALEHARLAVDPVHRRLVPVNLTHYRVA